MFKTLENKEIAIIQRLLIHSPFFGGCLINSVHGDDKLT